MTTTEDEVTPSRSLLRRVRSRLGRRERPPLVSVVVAFRDAAGLLDQCVEGLLRQTHPRLEIILVDDGSTDRSAADALVLEATHPAVRVVRQARLGVGAARNAGVREATGTYLAFCDADDRLPNDAYARLVGALEASGSDLVVGAATMQVKGRHLRPQWSLRSNPRRMLGVTVHDHPPLLANLVLGCRMFRLQSWRRDRILFPEDGAFPDLVTIVQTLASAQSLDVLPAVTYRWCWRQDGRTLVQRSLAETGLLRERLDRLREAGLLVNSLSDVLARSYFTELFHTTIRDLVRAAVTHEEDDGYWDALSEGLSDLLGLVAPATLAEVAVEDRVAAWLCGHGHRDETEQFLEYAFDNTWGYPYEDASPRPVLHLAFLEELAAAHAELARLAPVDLRFRTRLTDMTWTAPTVLTLRGGAFIEYVDDRRGPSQVTVVLREERTGNETRFAARACPDVEVDLWANRANEEHAGAGFEVDLDLSAVPWDGGREVLQVLVELEIDGERRRGGLGSRRTSSSAGLTEPSVHGDRRWQPGWRPFDGLHLVVQPSTVAPSPEVDPSEDVLDPLVQVTGWSTSPGSLSLDLDASTACEVALTGPRATSSWTRLDPGPGRVELPLLEDEWGVGEESPLPENRYDLISRSGDDVRPIALTPSLWRSLPVTLPADPIEVVPTVQSSGAVSFTIAPPGAASMRPPYARRKLRDQHYPSWRRDPLLDVALFETFGGRSAGDNPGALCRELLRRDSGLEVCVSVADLAVVTPPGARKVLRLSPEYFELLARSRHIVTNAALSYFFRRREGQQVVQTWHGTPLKRIAHDRPYQDFFNWHHRRQILTARENWDVLLSQSEFCTSALRSAFRYEGEVWEEGYPRNDLLQSPEATEVRQRTRKVLGLDDDENVVLYAPTWRDNVRVGAVFQKVLYLDAARLVKRMPGTTVLIRGHYNSVRDADVSAGRRILDVTRYPDIAELYLAADSLVTDYSSVFFDFALTDKPMVFLAPDLLAYRDENRGFYLDYHETVPGPVCETTDDVVDALLGGDDHAAARVGFRSTYAPRDDGSASRRINDRIFGTQA